MDHGKSNHLPRPIAMCHIDTIVDSSGGRMPIVRGRAILCAFQTEILDHFYLILFSRSSM